MVFAFINVLFEEFATKIALFHFRQRLNHFLPR